MEQIGAINNVKVSPGEDGGTKLALIEFETKEEALGALTRDQKTFHGNTIEVQLDAGSTLWVTNFPPTADEAYIGGLFNKVSFFHFHCMTHWLTRF